MQEEHFELLGTKQSHLPGAPHETAQTHCQAACACDCYLVLACVAVHLGQIHLPACPDQPAQQEKVVTMRIACQLADWHRPQ